MEIDMQAAIIAATSALSGVVISQAITLTLDWRDKRYKRKIHLRDKYEEMMLEVADSLTYPSDVCLCRTADELHRMMPPASLSKATILANIYFRELAPELDCYSGSVIDFYSHVVELYDAGNPHNVGGQLVQHGKDNPMLGLLDAKNSVLNALKDYAPQYTKA